MKNKNWTIEEDNIIKKFYPLYGLDYCTTILDRTKRAIQLRRKYLKVSKSNNIKEKYQKENLEKIIKESFTFKECLIKLGINNFGSSINTLKKYIKKYDINTEHFNNKIDIIIKRNTINIKDILINNSSYSTTHLKERLYKEGLKEKKCELCGQDEKWNGRHMSLILDHINGINNDNRLENLRIVCPNCNATLPTHCRGNKKLYEKIHKKELKRNKTNEYYLSQRIVERPPYEQLLNEIKELGYSGTGRKYNVSDNTIRKWKKYYEKHK